MNFLKLCYFSLFFSFSLTIFQKFSYGCFDFSKINFFVPVCPKTLLLFQSTFIWSYKVFVENKSTSLSIILDEESQKNASFILNLQKSLTGIKYMIFYGPKPLYNMTSHDRSQMYMFWADNFTNSEYVGFVDTDTLFTAKMHINDLFVQNKPRVSAFFRSPSCGFWKEMAVVTEMATGKVQPLHTMSYFPVLIKTEHLPIFRNHIQTYLNETGFDRAIDKLFRPLLSKKSHSGPSTFSQFNIMGTIMWFFLKNEYYWDIVYLKHSDKESIDYLNRIYILGQFKDDDFSKYRPRIAVHSKYEKLMSLQEMKIYSLCFSLKNFDLIKKFKKCEKYNLNSINLLQWSFETEIGKSNNFSYLENIVKLQNERDEMMSSCKSVTQWDENLISSTLL